MTSINEEWWIKEATTLRDQKHQLLSEVKRLQQYESMVHYIANDYIELSYEKAQCQRDDWLKRCIKTIANAPLEWTENYGQGSEPWLGDKDV